MIIEVKRKTFTEKATISDLSIDGKFICHILEDKVRGPNEPHLRGQTAIPAGEYQVQFRTEGTMFEALKKQFPDIRQERGSLHIFNIPGNVYPVWYNSPGVHPEACVLIHCGNKDSDTLGCLLVGDKVGTDCILPGTSSTAYRRLYPIVADALEKGEEVRLRIS